MPLKNCGQKNSKRLVPSRRKCCPQNRFALVRVTISHKFKPIAAVGGDFLDYFQLMDGTFGLYLCDVSGKGLPAALYAALSVGTLRGVHKTGIKPSEALATFNRRLLIRGMPRRHAAIQYAVLIRAAEICTSQARACPARFTSAPMAAALWSSGIPAGLFADTCYETLTVRLGPGDSVLFCTDGITDAFDREEEQFGVERLQELCGDQRQLSPAELLGKIFSAVEEFSCGREQHDDMAAALFLYSG